jgi:hypothetical protein
MIRVILGRAQPETEWSGKISGIEFSSNPSGRAGEQASTDRIRSHGIRTASGFGTDTILIVSGNHLGQEFDPETRDAGSDLDAVTEKGDFDATLSLKKDSEVECA